MRHFEMYFLMFFSLSVAGWMMEVGCKLIEFRRFINRGFLIGPYCPIYGAGAVLVCLLLGDDPESPLRTFIGAMLICGTLEYATGWLMEKLFSARWWDYSDRKFNINGRVCANTLIAFGTLSLLCIYIIKPALFSLFAHIPHTTMHIICLSLFTLLASDIAVSAGLLSRITRSAALTQADSTERLTQAVREELSRNRLFRRALCAFPHVRLYNRKLLTQLRETHVKLAAETNRIRETIRDGKDGLK